MWAVSEWDESIEHEQEETPDPYVRGCERYHAEKDEAAIAYGERRYRQDVLGR